jgi:putative transposase
MERFRFDVDSSVYFVTFTIVEWLPVFISQDVCHIIVESLNHCHEHKELRTNSYVVMPTHMHANLFDAQWDSKRLEATLHDFRKYTGRRICDYVDERFPAAFREVFRKAAGTDRKRRCWQASRHPVALESEWFWRQKLDYIHCNPCRKGLVTRPEYWRFSSASYWLSDGQTPNEVMLSAIEW